jgi:hypothetical protein
MTYALRSRKKNKEHKTSNNVDTATTFRQVSLTHPWCIHPLQFMLLFGSHGVSHPTRERRSPCSAGSVEEQKAPTDLGSAVESLDAVELD